MMDKNPKQPMPLPNAHTLSGARGPVLAAIDGSPSFRHWLADHQDALYAWCLVNADGRLDPEDFMAMAMAVGRERNDSALTDWLLWAALMLARGQKRSPERSESPALPAALQHLLDLAASEALRSTDVQDLLQRPVDQVGWRIEQIALRALGQAEHLAA